MENLTNSLSADSTGLIGFSCSPAVPVPKLAIVANNVNILIHRISPPGHLPHTLTRQAPSLFVFFSPRLVFGVGLPLFRWGMSPSLPR
jgi:hypothetical protein